uniref:Uncharacterized protein n=1 Tax=Syphacia muris TaxID=451379 RepID=A0A0N5AGI2_9BILA
MLRCIANVVSCLLDDDEDCAAGGGAAAAASGLCSNNGRRCVLTTRRRRSCNSSILSPSAFKPLIITMNNNVSPSESKIQSDSNETLKRNGEGNAESMLFSFEETLLDLQRLTLGVGEKREEKSFRGKKQRKAEVSENKEEAKSYSCATTCQPSISSLQQQPNVRRWFRYQPYTRPKMKWCVLLESRPLDFSSLVKELGDIRLNADVDDIRRLTLLSASYARLDLSGTCSFEATRYSSADEGMEGEVAELAEYFSQFVNVGLKMSSLAESMYA